MPSASLLVLVCRVPSASLLALVCRVPPRLPCGSLRPLTPSSSPDRDARPPQLGERRQELRAKQNELRLALGALKAGDTVLVLETEKECIVDEIDEDGDLSLKVRPFASSPWPLCSEEGCTWP